MAQFTLDALNAMSPRDFVAALGDTVEHAPWVAEAAAAQRPFADMLALLRAMTEAVTSSSDERKLALIKGHPDLAGKAARTGTLTADSKAEQASAGLDRLSEAEFSRFHLLNNDYRKKFGMPFIVCVRRHSKDSILREFERRLRNDVAAETNAALNEIFRIAALRLDQRIEAADRLKVHGWLSTHVLDTYGGHPAAGVTIELDELSGNGERRTITSAATNRDGRTPAPLISGRPIPIGTYELRFHVGQYFTRRSAPQADPPFLDIVPVQFAVAEPEGHYHVPLLITPWSYSTYRGS
jgi:2-oxo-4-hydroxy-4-carboxy-5-ureidoimidazoline decarboxylase